jgi:hypothetical protein
VKFAGKYLVESALDGVVTLNRPDQEEAVSMRIRYQKMNM